MSPEWLVRFKPGVAGLDGDGKPARPLTVADCCAAFAVLSSYTHEVLDPRTLTPAEAQRLTQLRREHQGQADELIMVRWQVLRTALGVDKRRDVERTTERLQYATNGRCENGPIPLFNSVDLYNGLATFTLSLPTTACHPLRSVSRQAVPVDVRSWAKMECVHSIPVAARITTWLATKCRVGLHRGVAEFSAGELTARFPVERAQAALGLSFSRFLPCYVPLDRIQADLAHAGIEAKLSWGRDGRTPDEVVVVARRKAKEGTPLRATQYATPGVTKGEEWRSQRERFKDREAQGELL